MQENGEDPMLAGFSNLIGANDFDLEYLPHLIETDPRFQLVSAVKEYRCVDLGGIFCTNVHTTYEAGTVSATRIIADLESVIHDMTSCLACIMAQIDCVYDDILQRCQSCEENVRQCVSMVAFQVRLINFILFNFILF